MPAHSNSLVVLEGHACGQLIPWRCLDTNRVQGECVLDTPANKKTTSRSSSLRDVVITIAVITDEKSTNHSKFVHLQLETHHRDCIIC